jgi:MFS family permease
MSEGNHEQLPCNPLGNAEFRKLFSAQVVALVGTGLSTVALALLAYDLAGTDAAAVLGTALGVKMLAYVGFAPVAGGLAYRFPRKGFLVTMDLLRATTILAVPFVTEVWQIYGLIFLLSLFSAGFTPVFAATIPDILPDERSYTRALSLSRLAYDLENLVSPTLAAVALLFASYTELFTLNSVAFVVSAMLVGATRLPARRQVQRLGSNWTQITFGVRAYLKTPRLRGLLALYLGVAAASAMVIVNTVVYVHDALGGSESDVAWALAAAGAGSMTAALGVPRLLDRLGDRPVMLVGALFMAAGLGLIAISPPLAGVVPIWFLIGVGWSLVQTPAGRVVNRSSAPADRPAYFSAQFALSHACWLVFYPVAGQLGALWGVEAAGLTLGLVVLLSATLAALLWPQRDTSELMHSHTEARHVHLHSHDAHHDHSHEGWEGPEPHSHSHRHPPVRHRHAYVIDDHHATWPGSSTP